MARPRTSPQPEVPGLAARRIAADILDSVLRRRARVVFVADLKGGSDDFEEFYCADVEWEWGDGTESENAIDCEPYESGKSKIQRHFATEHRYETAGEYRVVFRLKRQDKVVGAGTTVVRVRPGLRDIG